MQISRKTDIIFSAVTIISLLIIVLFAGDLIYAGLWYYIAVPIAALALAAVFRVKPLFLFGTSIAIATTLLAYMAINFFSAHPEGLLVLGHLFSLPGAGVGIIFGAMFARGLQNPIIIFLLALLCLLGGFFINQLIICNTVMWCGSLSIGISG